MSSIKQLTLAIACVLSLSMAYAQNKKVSGVVSATSGESVVGAAVFVKGTDTGVTTDLDGRFQINVPGSNSILVFSSIGYKEVEVKVGEKSKLDVILEEDKMVLEEAVAIGYGVQSKLTLTGSVTQTTGTELVKNSSVNLSQGLAGRLSGVIVNSRSGEPGKDDATMYIRGRSTLGDNSPLIIIDGVPGRSSDFSRLTGEEIETINVLKDASAAIYGARSANGVILVTTKRGKYGEAPKVTFTYDLGLQQPTRIVKMADAVLYTNAYNDLLDITGGAPMYTQAALDHYKNQDDPILYPNTNWFDHIIKPISAQHKYGVSINGGSENVAYFVQFNGQFQDGMYQNSATRYNQYNLRSNIDIQVTKSLKLSFDINARQQHKDYSAFASSDIFYITIKMKPTGAPYYPNGYIRGGTNPVIIVQDLTGYNKSTTNTINTNFGAHWDMSWLTKGLSVDAKLAYDVRQVFTKKFQRNWTYWAYDEITELYEEKQVSYFPTPTLNESQANAATTTINANITYDRDFSGHHVTALAGFEQASFRQDSFNAGINKYDSDILDEFFAGSADKAYYSIGGSAKETARRSFFGRLGYDYDSKYMIQGVVRLDGSENFPKKNRWGLFPGVSAGWRISGEPWIKDNFPWLTNLKIRGSYGEQGNDSISAFQYLTTYKYSTSTRYDMLIDGSDVSAIIPGNLPNANVTWEVARTWNLGLDGSINNGIFAWEVEYFKTRRSNILCKRNASIPYYSGLVGNLPSENIGIVSNQGVELQMHHSNRVGDFIYNVSGNFMFARNRIEYMDETPWGEGYERMNQTGRPMGAGLYYKAIGINKTQEDLEKYPQMSGATLGDLIYEDLDKDGKITNMDRYRADQITIPEIVFGVNFQAQWKGFDFSALLQGQARAKYYYAPLVDPVSGNLEYEAAANAWTRKNPTSDFPRLGSNVSNGSVTKSSFYHKNASFLRLKNVEIGYTIPQKVFNKLPIKGLRMYIAGYNLFTISELKNVDPETTDYMYAYPQMRIYNAGVKLTF